MSCRGSADAGLSARRRSRNTIMNMNHTLHHYFSRGCDMQVESGRRSSSEWPLAQDDELVQRVNNRLGGRFGNPVSNFQLWRREDGLVLRGVVKTYYAKQLVQEVVMGTSGQLVLANDIEVQCRSTAQHGIVPAQ